MSGSDLIAEARRLASWAPDKPESVHDVVCAGFNALAEQLAARTRDFLAAVERNEEKDRRIADLVEQYAVGERERIHLHARIAHKNEQINALEEQLEAERQFADKFQDEVRELQEQFEAARERLEWIADRTYVGNFDAEAVVAIHRKWAENFLNSNPASAAGSEVATRLGGASPPAADSTPASEPKEEA